MSRLSFRPRPLDIHKKLPIVKSVKDFEDEETTTSTRNSQILRLAAEADNEVLVQPLSLKYWFSVDSLQLFYCFSFDVTTETVFEMNVICHYYTSFAQC